MSQSGGEQWTQAVARGLDWYCLDPPHLATVFISTSSVTPGRVMFYSDRWRQFCLTTVVGWL